MQNKKKIISVILALIIALSAWSVVPFTANAVEAEVASTGALYQDDPDFNYMVDLGDIAEITEYKGKGGDVTIPSTLGRFTVTSIGMNAFSNCTSLTSVTIPDSVTNIDIGAFSDCTGLKSVTIGNSVTSIGLLAFYDCNGLTNVTIPDSVTTIDDMAFEGCTGLTSVIFGNSVTSIGEGAFEDCTGLTSIDIPDSVTSIGSGAFSGCTSLTNIDIPDSIGYISMRQFAGCTGLTSITIPDSVTSIGDSAFEDCTGLTSVAIGNSVTSIGYCAFCNCTGLTNLTIPDSVTTIGEKAFSGCAGLTSIKVAEGNTVYDSRDNCNAIIETESNTLIYGLKNTIIPNSVTSIEAWAFYNCMGLTSIDIPYSVTSISDYAFYDCTELTSVTIGSSVSDIRGFQGCTSLTSIKVAEGNTVYDSRDNCNAIIETESNKLIFGCKGTVIPDSVTSISDYAFYGCTELTSVTIPDSVKSIGNYAFYGCTGLTSVTIPDSVTSIGNHAFGFIYNREFEGEHKIDGFTIYGYEGSEAERYAKDNEFTFVPLKSKADVTTGIILAVPEDTDLTVKDITSDISSKLPGNFNVLTAYDISLTKDGETVQPENIVTVKIPCTNENAKVFRFEADGTMTDMNAKYKDGYMVFTTDHFSVYVLAEPNVKTGVTVSGTITSYVDDADVTIKLTGVDNNFTAEVKGKSEYSIADVPAGEYALTVSKANHVTREYTVTVADTNVTQDVKVCPKGDVNGDGETDIMDCSLAQRYIRELTTLDAYQIACGDVSGTGDGELDIQDVSRILRHIRELAMLY